ncbi:MAG: RNA polymerase sigma factor [Butyrivibrio sp.]|nr:RNA polymerase sigma factor [Butyrivibrio sp.]
MDNGASSYRHFLDGDDSAFSEIIDLYRDSLIFFINRTVNNLSAAEDLAADTLAELFVSRRYNFSVKLKTYLFAIAHHKTVSYIRHQSRYGMLALEDVEDKSAEYTDFEERLIRDERSAAVHEALGKLDEDYRQALHLIYFEEMSYEDAARIMKKSRKQIDNLVYRGKSALRRILEKEGFVYEE